MKKVLSLFVLLLFCASVFAAVHGFQTYINDYADRYLEDRMHAPQGAENSYNNFDIKPCFTGTPTVGHLTNTSPEIADPLIGSEHGREITQYQFSPLANTTFTDSNGTGYVELQTIWVTGTTIYDETLKTVVANTPNTAYKVDFRQYSAESLGLPTTSANKVVIKFLGGNWRIKEMNAPNLTGYDPLIHYGSTGSGVSSLRLVKVGSGEEMVLLNNQQIANNPTWYSYIYWAPDPRNNNVPTLKTIVIMKSPASVATLKLMKADSMSIMTAPRKFDFTFDALNFSYDNYDILTLQIAQYGLTVSPTNNCSNTTNLSSNSYLLYVASGMPNAFTVDNFQTAAFYVDPNLGKAGPNYTYVYYQPSGVPCYYRKKVSAGPVAAYNLGDGQTQWINIQELFFYNYSVVANLTINVTERASTHDFTTDAYVLGLDNATSGIWAFSGTQTQSKIGYAPTGLATLTFPLKLVELGYTSERGSIFNSLASTAAVLKMSKSVQEATYYLSPVGPICGNNICEPGESCSTCSDDCGQCPCTASWFCMDGKTRAYRSESCQITYYPCGAGPWCCKDGACYKSTSSCPNYVSTEIPNLAQVQGPDTSKMFLLAFGMVVIVGVVVYAFMRHKN